MENFAFLIRQLKFSYKTFWGSNNTFITKADYNFFLFPTKCFTVLPQYGKALSICRQYQSPLPVHTFRRYSRREIKG